MNEDQLYDLLSEYVLEENLPRLMEELKGHTLFIYNEHVRPVLEVDFVDGNYEEDVYNVYTVGMDD